MQWEQHASITVALVTCQVPLLLQVPARRTQAMTYSPMQCGTATSLWMANGVRQCVVLTAFGRHQPRLQLSALVESLCRLKATAIRTVSVARQRRRCQTSAADAADSHCHGMVHRWTHVSIQFV
jgi:hypothetical protein